MASAAPPKRMVSSVFITLASPHRATVTPQQQPALQAQSSPPETSSTPRQTRPKVQSKAGSRDRTRAAALSQASGPTLGKSVPGKSSLQKEEDQRSPPELFPPPPPPPDAQVSTLGHDVSALSPLHPAQTPFSHLATPDQPSVYNKVVETSTPSSGFNQDEQSHGTHTSSQDMSPESKDVCGFCRKPMALPELVIEALNRTYHEGCFQCRSCHIPLAGKQYYNKAGIPLCEDCYQAILELCWACGEVITDHVIRALERAYHPLCFTCTTCKKQIGEQAFAQGEVGEVYCLQDYYRKYAPQCSACDRLIIPKEDGTDSYTVECLGQSFHENCYRCEVCGIQLSTEPNERGCYPLDG
ncbi:filamin-binding LIM protein 1-like, partial [Salarias fasciatus]|uniref:filamin-binding LIM protein 1-like n=1 Tax=Salarias fasciatus TaxID=181472 RepID=UPI001176882C